MTQVSVPFHIHVGGQGKEMTYLGLEEVTSNYTNNQTQIFIINYDY